MYLENACWMEFYRELDPDRRRDLYEEIARENEDDGANAFRRELMELRYTDPKDPRHRVDNFLWQMVILPGYLRPMYLIRAVGEREIRKIVTDLGLDGAGDWDDVKRSAAYWEFRNAADRYLSTCTGPGYAKKVFGIMQSTDEEKLNKTAKDFYSMTVTVPAKYGREEELEIFIAALQDSFLASSRDAGKAWNMAKNLGRKKG